MKLISDATALHLTHKGIANFASLSGFVKNSIDDLPSICKNYASTIEADATNSAAAKTSVFRASISSMKVSRLIKSSNDANHCGSISRAMNPQKISHDSSLATFKIEHKKFFSMKGEDDSNAPKINDRDKDRKIFSWDPMFKNCL